MTCRHFDKMRNIDEKVIYTAAFILYMTAVAVLCFLRPENLPQIETVSFLGIPTDKLLHFMLFFPFTILSSGIFINRKTGLPQALAIIVILTLTGTVVAYGTEIIQSYTGYRTFEAADFHADAAGIAVGTAFYIAYIIFNRLKR